MSPLEQSPYTIEISSPKRSKLRAFGPGLYCAYPGRKNVFSISTNAEDFSEVESITIEGPSSAHPEMEIRKRGSNIFDVNYSPSVSGVLFLSVYDLDLLRTIKKLLYE